MEIRKAKDPAEAATIALMAGPLDGQVNPEQCIHCRANIWMDDEIDCWVDIRFASTNPADFNAATECRGTTRYHETSF
jgi:hypothetical protein